MRLLPAALASAVLAVAPVLGQTVLFEDDFNGRLGPGWSWVREHREAWRVSARGLEVRVEPGNMWGRANDARNVLLRPAPDLSAGPVDISVTVENRPSAQYEQVDLVWYYDDSHMVKIGQELVDGQLSIVMGREENDRTRTIRIVPTKAFVVELRFLVKDTSIRGQFRPVGSGQWQEVGQTDMPAPVGGTPQISLQFYQGPADAEHWARVSQFRVQRP
jgi:regulation of enolase protein 1 (concanavalin A-like superfamily)